MFGYQNHVGIDREHGLIRRFTVTHAAAHDGAQRGAVLDPATPRAQSGRTPLTALLARRSLKPAFQRAKPRGKPMPRHIARGNARRAKSGPASSTFFAAQKRRFDLVIRTVGKARAAAKLALADLAYNFTRLAWLEASSAA